MDVLVESSPAAEDEYFAALDRVTTDPRVHEVKALLDNPDNPAHLRPKERVYFHSRYFEGLDNHVLAERHGVTPHSVSETIRTATRKVALYLNRPKTRRISYLRPSEPGSSGSRNLPRPLHDSPGSGGSKGGNAA
jgi:hypothetical protein